MISDLRVLSRRALALLLSLMILGLTPALAAPKTEKATLPGFSFSLKLGLDLSGVSPVERDRLRGYADFLDSMTFEGTWYAWPEKHQIDLSLNIIPENSSGSPLYLHIYGPESDLMLASPVLGDRPLHFFCDSLLAFSVKAHEHMGLNLQYLVLLYPHVYEFATRVINYSWVDDILKPFGSHEVSAEKVRTFTKKLEENLTDDASPVASLIDVLEICEGYDEVLISEVMNLPHYLQKNVCHDAGVDIEITDSSETWSCEGKNLYEMKKTASGETVKLSLPDTDTGFRPHFSLQTETDGGLTDVDLSAGWLSQDPDEKEDLVSLVISGRRLPAAWPVETESEFSLALTGSLFPRVLLEGSLNSKPDGRVSVKIKSPAGSELAAGAVLTAEGTVLSETFQARTYTEEEMAACMDILRVNDVTLAAWVQEVLPYAVEGLLGFLVGVPASTYQSVMDDLTDSGVLGLFLSVD